MRYPRAFPFGFTPDGPSVTGLIRTGQWLGLYRGDVIGRLLNRAAF